MLPALKDQDYVITRSSSNLHQGDMIVMDLPQYGKVIKRIKSITADTINLSGDNPRLSSSCCEQPQLKKHLLGKIIAKFTLPF